MQEQDAATFTHFAFCLFPMCTVQVTQLNDRMFRNHMEDCLSFGKPLLIENIEEELDPLMDPVLERRVIKKVQA